MKNSLSRFISSLEYNSLCSLCHKDYPCLGRSDFTKEEIFYNFDLITSKIYPIGVPRSADAYYYENGKIYLIEIKDRKVDNLIFDNKNKHEIMEKLLDSIYTIKKNLGYFNNANISSFVLLCSHIKREGSYATKLNLRILTQSVGITMIENYVVIPIRSINMYSTHVQNHKREPLTGNKDIILKFKLLFCDTISKADLE